MIYKKDYTDLNRKMVVHILHTANWLDNKISSLLKKYGITHVQYNVLKSLEFVNPNPMAVGDVKNGLLFPNSDITRILDRLVEKDLVERHTCPENRRKIDVTITKKGLNLLNEIAPEMVKELDNYYQNKISKEDALFISDKLKSLRK